MVKTSDVTLLASASTMTKILELARRYYGRPRVLDVVSEGPGRWSLYNAAGPIEGVRIVRNGKRARYRFERVADVAVVPQEEPIIVAMAKALLATREFPWVHSAGVTNDIEKLRPICLAYSRWNNDVLVPLLEEAKAIVERAEAEAPRGWGSVETSTEEGGQEAGTRQAVLFSGLGCLPGQMDLFSTDGEG